MRLASNVGGALTFPFTLGVRRVNRPLRPPQIDDITMELSIILTARRVRAELTHKAKDGIPVLRKRGSSLSDREWRI